MITEFMEFCMCRGHSLGVAIGAPQVTQMIGEAGRGHDIVLGEFFKEGGNKKDTKDTQNTIFEVNRR